MSQLTRQQAHKLVDSIRTKKGRVSEAVRATMHPEALEAMNNLQEIAGAAAIMYNLPHR